VVPKLPTRLGSSLTSGCASAMVNLYNLGFLVVWVLVREGVWVRDRGFVC